MYLYLIYNKVIYYECIYLYLNFFSALRKLLEDSNIFNIKKSHIIYF